MRNHSDVRIDEEPSGQPVHAAGQHRREHAESEHARREVGGGADQHQADEQREVFDERGRVHVQGEQERIERAALHVAGERRADALVRVPEREVALGRVPVHHVHPRVERRRAGEVVDPGVVADRDRRRRPSGVSQTGRRATWGAVLKVLPWKGTAK